MLFSFYKKCKKTLLEVSKSPIPAVANSRPREFQRLGINNIIHRSMFGTAWKKELSEPKKSPKAGFPCHHEVEKKTSDKKYQQIML